MKKIFYTFFLGNYFYGVCAVALSIEASIQQNYALNHPLYYIALFCATVLFYTHAYKNEKTGYPQNDRDAWYALHRKKIHVSQWVCGFILISAVAYSILFVYQFDLSAISLTSILLAFIFPLVALFYNIQITGSSTAYGLRKYGWLKPFVIGFVWAGAVTLYPLLFKCLETGSLFKLQLFNGLLFLKNGMFIAMLCILFDIKDYAADHNQQLKTFVVRYGLRKTLYYIILPLTLLGWGVFMVYGFIHQFTLQRIVFNTIPFILLITVTQNMHQRKSILYYLAIIDGLMLVKAICGIAGSYVL